MSHLLFGLVELLPREIPLPAAIPEEQYRAGSIRIRHMLRPMVAREAVAWFESAMSGTLTVPSTAHQVRVGNVAPEPPIGSLVLADRPPISAAWHAQPRISRLVRMDDVTEPVRQPMDVGLEGTRGTSPKIGPKVRRAVRLWIAERVHFDLFGSDDCLGGMLLFAPNPVLRGASEAFVGTDVHGNDRIEVRTIGRQGADLSTLKVRIEEHRQDGTSWNQETRLDDIGRAIVTASGRVEKVTMWIDCATRGPLVRNDPTPLGRGVEVFSQIMDPGIVIVVPPRSKSTPATQQSAHVVGSPEPPVGRVRPPSAPERLATLLRRRELRPGLEGEAFGLDKDEHVLVDDREGAVMLIRGLARRATTRLFFVDQYFGDRDLREFASAVMYGSCRVGILTGRSHWNELDELTDRSALGALMLVAIEELNDRLRRPTGGTFDVRIMEGQRKYHDRFLVVDDQAWLVGNSFNRLGMRDVSMVSPVRTPGPVLEMLEEDFARARPFAEVWAEIQAQSPSKRCCQAPS